MKWIVRACDKDFVEVEKFNNFYEAIKYADEIGEIFGSWNVEMYSI